MGKGGGSRKGKFSIRTAAFLAWIGVRALGGETAAAPRDRHASARPYGDRCRPHDHCLRHSRHRTPRCAPPAAPLDRIGCIADIGSPVRDTKVDRSHHGRCGCVMIVPGGAGATGGHRVSALAVASSNRTPDRAGMPARRAPYSASARADRSGLCAPASPPRFRQGDVDLTNEFVVHRRRHRGRPRVAQLPGEVLSRRGGRAPSARGAPAPRWTASRSAVPPAA